MSDLENSSSPQEVEWQVAWFALLALGLAAMLQPCGNVLCQKANNHRFYIRASPVVCIVDVAQFIAFILLGFSCNPQAWLQNIKFELRQRFEGEDGAKDREKAENSIIVRWILMILGASLFNAIKLMMMQGIPWTQAWAMMFAISIVFAEVLILLVRFLSLDGSSAHTTPPAWRSYKISNVLDHIGIIPISLQFAVSYWTFFSFVLDPEGLPKHGPAGVAVGVTFGIIFLIPTGLEIIKGRIPGEFKGYQLYSLGCFAVISSLLSIPYVLDISSDSGWLLLLMCFGGFYATCINCWELANNVPRFIHGNFLGRLCRVDSFQGSQAATLCFLTFLASILYYGATYDPSGTKIPELTGVFG